MGVNKRAYINSWQKQHPEEMRAHKRAWYYKNRDKVNIMFTKPSVKTELKEVS